MKKHSSVLQELFMFQKHRLVSFPQNVAPLFAFRIALVLLSRRKSKRIISLKIQKTAMACNTKIPSAAITQSQKSEEKEIPTIFSPISKHADSMFPTSSSITHIRRLSSIFHGLAYNRRRDRKMPLQSSPTCKGVSLIWSFFSATMAIPLLIISKITAMGTIVVASTSN